MSRVMRKKARVCYYEPEEPNFDEYVFCTSCGDYVYEYCSIHGPLLVIPDDQVSTPTGLPPFVPNAALTIPHIFLHLAPSTIPDAGIGVFSTLTLPRGVRFGPYRGLKTDEPNSTYCWQIFDGEHKPSHILDARDPHKSNWMRYVNCSRHYSEQNLVAFQYQRQLYYRTIRIVPRFTELLVFYGSAFASELNIDLRRYHSPVYTQTLVKCDDDKSLDVMQPAGASRVINELQNVTEEFTPNLNNDGHYRNPSESNSLVIDLDDWEENGTDEYNSQMNEDSERKSLFDLDLNENVDSNDMTQDTHESDNCSQLNEKPANVAKLATSNRIDKHVCSICSVKFTSKSDHINHDIKIHNSIIKHHACTVCNYKTVKRYNLKKHVETHSYKQNCDQNYEASSSTKTPSQTTHETDSVNFENSEHNTKTKMENSCTICGNIYRTNYSLKRHLKNHQEKTHECIICNRMFLEKQILNRHMIIHSADNPHICLICNKPFSANYDLKRHMKTHVNLNENS